MIHPENPDNARQASWELLIECVKYPNSTELERSEYFHTLTGPAHSKDFCYQLVALEQLTNHGRNIAGFYYEMFPLLTLWLNQAYRAARDARKLALARGATKNSSKGKAPASPEDKNLSQLFALVKDVIKFNFKFATDDVIAGLIDMLLKICMLTSVEDDLRACIHVIESLVTFGSIPTNKLKYCIQVLSSIHCLVPSLQKEAWHTISIICRSHHGQSTVRILLDFLRSYSPNPDKNREKDTVRDVRGALSVLQKLLRKTAEKGYPQVPLSLLVGGLANVSKSSSTRVATEILRLINSLFHGREGNINPILVEEHWEPIFDVAAQCATKAVTLPPADASASPLPTVAKEEPVIEDNVSLQLKHLILRVENLIVHQGPELLQRDDCMKFLIRVQHALPDSAAALLVGYLRETRGCFPSEIGWKENLNLILNRFYLNRARDPLTRMRALEVVAEVYDFLCLAEGLVEQEVVEEPVQSVLSGLVAEDDALVLQETVSFLVTVAQAAKPSLFDDVLNGFKAVLHKEMSRSPASVQSSSSRNSPAQQTLSVGPSLSNLVTRGYVQIFLRTMNVEAWKAVKAFTALVHVARSNSCELDARITAMRLLFRLRADADNQVYVTPLIENESLAGTLYRTESSMARKLADEAAQAGRLSRPSIANRPGRGLSFSQGQTVERGIPTRSASTPKPTSHVAQKLWVVPDVDALPEAPPEAPSLVLLSHKEEDSVGQAEAEVLDMSSWLDALLSLFHHGCDWEVYSFILVHLPAQLSNHPIFRGAIPHIRELRRLLCEMLRGCTFQEPPFVSGLRRTDVANCLYHSLTMILSYHHHFSKVDEDDIVQTFTHGIPDKTAKTCIHALSVCCHELPMSVSKSLITILGRMSQVITQPFVAMHILEFLACLSRLHSLYSNFREDDYRIVFGICFRYLQYVREKKHAMRGSIASEPATPSVASASQHDVLGHQATDDLPQYVYALAYHVITFWFLAVKLPDRPNHIGWIAKNLFTDVDGSASNEEQAQITLDFMQRVAFSDASDSAQDPLFKEEYFGTIHKKRWIIGNSLVTIRQAKDSNWAEITRRYPSGTSSYAVRVEFTPMPGHAAPDGSDAMAWDGRFQQGITIFPSHLLMQLLAPMPQIYDPAVRPIPLPDEEAVDRAIRSFDLNSPVDGHKVGVIYIKEGQTHETEILANTMGSPDYHRFLKGLGALTRLKGATFNTQGLDRVNDMDGQYTYCWRDRVTEIVFHVTTQMPTNLEHDPQCIMKKRHIGNDFVNIVWNDSGKPFRFDTFPSQFNYVYIVITPTPRVPFLAARTARKEDDDEQRFVMVQVMSQPGFPEISPAAEPKIISLKALPSFVRLLALNASVFSLVWANREGGEHVSSWRNRLREINRLRERYGPKTTGSGGGGPLQGISPSPPPGIQHHSHNHQYGHQFHLGGSHHHHQYQFHLPSITQQPMTLDLSGTGSPGGPTPSAPTGPGGSASGSISGPSSRPSSMPLRDSISISSLRRSSVATFFTNNSSSTDPSTPVSAAAPGQSQGQQGPGGQPHRLSAGAVSNPASESSIGTVGTGVTTVSGGTEGTGGTGGMGIVGATQYLQPPVGTTAEALVESVDFSKWT